MSRKAIKSQNVDFLTKPISGIGREGAIAQVIQHYKKEKHSPLILLEKVEEWNREYCQPPFLENDIKMYIQFFLQQVFQENQNSKEVLSKQVYDVIKGDPTLYLFVDQNKVPYARVRVGNKLTNLEINSSEFQNAVRSLFFQKTKKFVSDLQIKETLGLFTMEAIIGGQQHALYNRVAHLDNHVYYNLQNEFGDVVDISAEGWSIKTSEEVPIMFKNGLGQEQVRPERIGNLRNFLRFINIPDEDERILFLSTLAVRLIQDIDQAVIYIYGPAGSGKTTLLKMTKDLIDPSAGGISIPVKDVGDVLPLVGQTWVLCNDNVSKLTDNLSDFFCTMATGGESSTRKLYTNGDVHIFTVKNPAYLTGISVEANKSDLLSRTLLFKTQAVNKNRKVGSELKEQFEEMKPELLGGLFSILSEAMEIRESYEFKTDFRLTDFALWGAACAMALGFPKGRFEAALKKSMKSRAYDAIYSSSAGRALLHYFSEHKSFTGTATELLNALKDKKDDYDREWYESVAYSPASLGKKMRELENSLLEIGISIDFDHRSEEKRIITITTQGEVTDSTDGTF